MIRHRLMAEISRIVRAFERATIGQWYRASWH
jgi:hypothetical protein